MAAAGHAGSRDGIAPGARENRVPNRGKYDIRYQPRSL